MVHVLSITIYIVLVDFERLILFQEEPKSTKVPPFQMSYEATGLKKKARYEFWVTASTNIGEGQPSKPVQLAPSNRGN